MDEKNRRIKELELEVENEKMEQKKQLDLLDQEVILIPFKWADYWINMTLLF